MPVTFVIPEHTANSAALVCVLASRVVDFKITGNGSTFQIQ
jgi:hypothetical protein